jgi:putative FmdB family regulatory protein
MPGIIGHPGVGAGLKCSQAPPVFRNAPILLESPMPIYEYQCKSCGHEMEAIQKITDDPLKECPACGDLELNKLISAAGFRLKGGGWYETDFKGGKDKKRNLAGGGETSTPAPAEAASGDAAATAKKEAPTTPAAN